MMNDLCSCRWVESTAFRELERFLKIARLGFVVERDLAKDRLGLAAHSSLAP